MPFFKRPPRPATPPGTPAWQPGQSLDASKPSLPAHLEAGFLEPENLLGAGSAASLAIFAAIFSFSPLFPAPAALYTVVGVALTVLQATGWAATVGIGLTSRFRPFRLMGWATALTASSLYLWKHASGLPAYSFFGLAGMLSLAMNVGNLAAWWLSRRRRSGA
jgi:hypothetical protein